MLEVWVHAADQHRSDILRTALAHVPGVRPREVDREELGEGPGESVPALVVELALDESGADPALEGWRGRGAAILGVASDRRPRRLARARERYELFGVVQGDEPAAALFERLAGFVSHATTGSRAPRTRRGAAH